MFVKNKIFDDEGGELKKEEEEEYNTQYKYKAMPISYHMNT